MFRNIPGSYLLVPRTTPFHCTSQKSFQTLSNVSWVHKIPIATLISKLEMEDLSFIPHKFPHPNLLFLGLMCISRNNITIRRKYPSENYNKKWEGTLSWAAGAAAMLVKSDRPCVCDENSLDLSPEHLRRFDADGREWKEKHNIEVKST